MIKDNENPEKERKKKIGSKLHISMEIKLSQANRYRINEHLLIYVRDEQKPGKMNKIKTHTRNHERIKRSKNIKS